MHVLYDVLRSQSPPGQYTRTRLAINPPINPADVSRVQVVYRYRKHHVSHLKIREFLDKHEARDQESIVDREVLCRRAVGRYMCVRVSGLGSGPERDC